MLFTLSFSSDCEVGNSNGDKMISAVLCLKHCECFKPKSFLQSVFTTRCYAERSYATVSLSVTFRYAFHTGWNFEYFENDFTAK